MLTFTDSQAITYMSLYKLDFFIYLRTYLSGISRRANNLTKRKQRLLPLSCGEEAVTKGR